MRREQAAVVAQARAMMTGVQAALAEAEVVAAHRAQAAEVVQARAMTTAG